MCRCLYGHVYFDVATSVDLILFVVFMGVWDPSNQLEAELALNLPQEMCKMVGYEMKFEDFRFGKNTEKTRTEK